MKGNRDRFHAGEDIFFPNPVSQMMFMIKKPVQKRTGFGIKNSKLELLKRKYHFFSMPRRNKETGFFS